MNAPKVILAGGHGFLGQVLSHHFQTRGWEVCVLTRTPAAEGARWDPGQAKARNCARPAVRDRHWDGRTLGEWTAELEGATALINLSGRSVDCRYHERNKLQILNSRVNSTRILGEAIALSGEAPRVWLNSSTATIYKHSFDRPMDEAGEIGATIAAKDAF